MGKKSGSGSGMNNLDHISQSLKTNFWVKTLILWSGSGMEKSDLGWKQFGSGMQTTRIRDANNSDPGSKQLGSGRKKVGSGINIPDPQHREKLPTSWVYWCPPLRQIFFFTILICMCRTTPRYPRTMRTRRRGRTTSPPGTPTFSKYHLILFFQRCGTVTIFYGSGSDFWKVKVQVPVPVLVPVLVPIFDTLRFRFRIRI